MTICTGASLKGGGLNPLGSSTSSLHIAPAADNDAAKVTQDKWPDVHQSGEVAKITMDEVVADRRWLHQQPHFLPSMGVTNCPTPKRCPASSQGLPISSRRAKTKRQSFGLQSACAWTTRCAKLSQRVGDGATGELPEHSRAHEKTKAVLDQLEDPKKVNEQKSVTTKVRSVRFTTRTPTKSEWIKPEWKIGEVLPTFVPFVRRDRPQTALAGIRSCGATLTSSNGEKMGHRPPQRQRLALSNFARRELLMGFGKATRSLAGLPKKRIRSVSVIGNSWHCGTVAWLVGVSINVVCFKKHTQYKLRRKVCQGKKKVLAGVFMIQLNCGAACAKQ